MKRFAVPPCLFLKSAFFEAAVILILFREAPYSAALIAALFFITVIIKGAQSQELTRDQAIEITGKLTEKAILTQKGKQELVKLIEEKELSEYYCAEEEGERFNGKKVSMSSLLNYCRTAFTHEQIFRSKNSKVEENIPREDSLIEKGGWGLNISPNINFQGTVSEERSTIGKTRSRTLEDLKEVDLINDWAYSVLKTCLTNETIVNEIDLFRYAAHLMYVHANYDSIKEEQLSFLKELNRKGVLSDFNLDQIIKSYGSYEVKNKFEILSFCNTAVVLRVDDLPQDFYGYYKKIWDTLTPIIPGFKYTNLELKIDERQEDHYLMKEITLSFNVDGKKFSHTFLDELFYTRKENAEPVRVMASTYFHHGINDFLSSTGSPYRLLVKAYPGRFAGANTTKIGLVLLTDDQRETWKRIFPDYQIHRGRRIL